MDSLRDRLIECFAITFPDRPRESIPTASREDEDWDSLAMVTLLSLIEEEFGITATPDNLESFVTFETALAYLEAEVGGGAG